MKNKTLLSFLSIGAISISGITSVQASSSFSGSATLAITIDSIINATNPDDNSGVEISGLFEMADSDSAPGVGETVTGDGHSSTEFAGGKNLSQTFSVMGNVNNGSVDSYYQTLGNLKFNNHSSDSYTVNFSMDYALETSVTGDFATNTVSLDYSSNSGDIGGFAEVSADSSLNLSEQMTDNISFTINLDGFQSDIFFADIAINGYAEASAVPLPAAGWLMLSALVFLRRFFQLNRRVSQKRCTEFS